MPNGRHIKPFDCNIPPKTIAPKLFIQNFKEKRETTEPLAAWDLNVPNTTVEQISRVIGRETLTFGNVATARAVKSDLVKSVCNQPRR